MPRPSRFLISCDRCGAQRPSTKSMANKFRPKLCKACALDDQRKRLAKMMRRPLLDRRPSLPAS